MIRPEFDPKSEPRAINDLKYDELVEMIDVISDPETDEETGSYYEQTIELTMPGARVADLILWPDDWFQDDTMADVDLSPAEIASYVLAWTGKNLRGTEKITLPKIPKSKQS
ncbi:MAG: hypothetical protein P1U86_06575 [Verrucomicrobiales bacterium]|nr:hypothetical protein [Verrucomicrobiales bacterium]